MNTRAARATRTRFNVGALVYPATMALALLSPWAMLAVHGLLAVYYAFNQLTVPGNDPGPAVSR